MDETQRRKHKHGGISTLLKHYSLPSASSLSNIDLRSFGNVNRKWVALSFLLFSAIIVPCLYLTVVPTSACDSTESTSRNLLAGGDDCFEMAADPGWMAVFHFIGCLYMFIALAIVCDEFFVPSLETITLKLNISNDVAGATLMAAGGSAPELFTSLIGTFQETDVGFAAIVGSAVFNVLFVIGICAFSAPKPLELTWWPLARDCSYYAFSLSLLSVFFGPISSRRIEWFESLTLFIFYIGYVVLMKYNEALYEWIIYHTKSRSDEFVVPERSKTREVLETLEVKLKEQKKNFPSVPINAQDLYKTTFRAGMINILLKDEWDWNDVASISVVNSICGDVTETFEKLDVNNDGFLSLEELAAMLEGLGTEVDYPVEQLMAELDDNGDGQLSFNEFSVWYVRSEERIMGAMRLIFEAIDQDDNGQLNASEIRAFLLSVGVDNISREEVRTIFRNFGSCNAVVDVPDLERELADVGDVVKVVEVDSDSEAVGQDVKELRGSTPDIISKSPIRPRTAERMSFDQFKAWFIQTEYYTRKLSVFTKQADQIQGVEDTLQFPEGWGKRLWFIVSIPLIVMFLYSIPDTRKPKLAKYCYVSFVVSILWIMVFSYFMVTWTRVVGDTLHIPLVVMGLTFLAAGTSIPDLLSSVIVAKQGFGDMAVSSSIGSNIFDVLVGLPVPWMLYSAFKSGVAVEVNADGLEISILILLGMLVLIVGIIKLAKWRMTRRLGVSMILFYFVFVAQDLARADWGC